MDRLSYGYVLVEGLWGGEKTGYELLGGSNDILFIRWRFVVPRRTFLRAIDIFCMNLAHAFHSPSPFIILLYHPPPSLPILHSSHQVQAYLPAAPATPFDLGLAALRLPLLRINDTNIRNPIPRPVYSQDYQPIISSPRPSVIRTRTYIHTYFNLNAHSFFISLLARSIACWSYPYCPNDWRT